MYIFSFESFNRFQGLQLKYSTFNYFYLFLKHCLNQGHVKSGCQTSYYVTRKQQDKILVVGIGKYRPECYISSQITYLNVKNKKESKIIFSFKTETIGRLGFKMLSFGLFVVFSKKMRDIFALQKMHFIVFFRLT